MKKFLPSLFIFFFALVFQTASSQTLYINTNGTGKSFGPGFGGSGTPIIVFDDVNIPNALIPDTDSMGITKLKIGIVMYSASSASVIKVYATPFDPLAVGYDSLPAVPPVLIGTVNIPANPGAAARGTINLGDSINSIFNFKNDPNNVYTDLTTIFIGLSFSDENAVGWELSRGPGSNDDVLFLYDVDDPDDPRYATWFGGDPKAAFRMEVFGKPTAKPSPVVLTNFDVQTVNNKNVLAWSTSQESNSDYYSIGHSTDGNNFEPIGQVAAAGNSSNVSTYSYTDANPAAGINYYRLKMVDLDNSVKYSAVKSVRNAAVNLAFRAYPNPAQEVLYLEIPSDKIDKAYLSVTNISGQIVLKSEINVNSGINTVPVKINTLSAGTYIIKVQLDNQNFIKKINKQ